MRRSHATAATGSIGWRRASLPFALVACLVAVPDSSARTVEQDIVAPGDAAPGEGEHGDSGPRDMEGTGPDVFAAPALPDGLSVVALIDENWRVLVAEEGRLVALEDVVHPRSVAYHHGTRRVAWIGADNRLRERDLESGVTEPLGKDGGLVRYTQPSYSPNGEQLLAVELPDGKSRSTRIVAFDLGAGERHYLVRKRTAQFEPHMGTARMLHYTTAICVDDCIGMIWELWERDLANGLQRQLTLLNAVSKSPRLGADGWLYFSSDAGGTGHHVWRMRPEPGAATERLTDGEVRDSDPSPGADGAVHFIRHTRERAAPLRRSPGSGRPRPRSRSSRTRPFARRSRSGRSWRATASPTGGRWCSPLLWPPRRSSSPASGWSWLATRAWWAP